MFIKIAVVSAVLISLNLFAQESNQPQDVSITPDTTPQVIEPSDSSAITETPPETPQESSPETVQENSSEPTHDVLADDAELPSPTANYELYEETRLKRFQKSKEPNWSTNFTYEHHAFPTTDFKKPTNPPGLAPGKIPSQVNPIFRGFLISGERILTRTAGYISLGIEGGVYASQEQDGFNKLPMGLIPAAAYFQYQMHYVDKQWVVPIAKAEYEVVVQNYQYEGSSNKGINQILRADAGALIYMNFLEPWAAGAMQANYGVKRTYLSATFTFANDMTKKTFDLSEKNWRVGFRFEY